MILLILVETSKSNGSDVFYIKSVLDEYYSDNENIIYKWIYMNGKTKYNRYESQIEKYKKQNKNVKIFICFDLDSDENQDKKLNDSIFEYARKNNYEAIWFKDDIEEVFLGKKINNNDKKQKAYSFIVTDSIKNIDTKRLSNENKKLSKTSNIMLVLDKYLTRNKS